MKREYVEKVCIWSNCDKKFKTVKGDGQRQCPKCQAENEHKMKGRKEHRSR